MKRKNKRNLADNEAATIESTTLHPGINIGSPALGRRKERRGISKKWLLIPAFIIIIVVTVYFAGVVYYKSHFFKGTNVYGTDVSQMEVQDFEEGLSAYSLKIIQKDKDGMEFDSKEAKQDIQDMYSILVKLENLILEFEEEFSSDALGLMVSSTDELVKIIDGQNEWLWPLQHNDVYGGKPSFIGCDQDKINEVVKSLSNMQEENITKPKNAYISGYKKGKGYEIVSETQGNELDAPAVIKAVESAVKGLKTEINCEELGLYKKPSVSSGDKKLNKTLNKLNKYTSTDITYEFGSNTEVLDGDTINKWLSVKKGRVKIDENEVSEFVASIRRKYDTIFRPRKFKTSYGETITIAGGDYGWWMNTPQEIKELTMLIKKGKQGKRTPCYYQTADRYGKRDYGDTYVEVNLTAQHVILYKDGKMVLETDCVTGNSARGFDTPAGVYGITYKQRDATLNGENYSTPVSYWMPFNKNIGLHDAGWRSSFGGELYKTSGSHGCVNLPPEKARQIYDVIQTGTPVICYNLPGTKGGDIAKAAKNEDKNT